MRDEGWDAVETELDRAGEDGRPIRVWLRDDDAVEVSPALERLHRICDAAAMPVLLAVIPAGATPALAAWVSETPSFTPCQHGYAHVNRAPAGARACELGGGRSIEAIVADLRAGRARLEALFGPRLSDCLVPPWNRIDPDVIPHLPNLGFDRLSVFGPPEAEPGGIRRLNTDLDIIDWRGGRIGRPMAEVARKLAALIAQAREYGRPIGLLTHHLAHDETAWSVLDEVLGRLSADRRVAFASARSL